MFEIRYFTNPYFPGRYFPHVGQTPPPGQSIDLVLQVPDYAKTLEVARFEDSYFYPDYSAARKL